MIGRIAQKRCRRQADDQENEPGGDEYVHDRRNAVWTRWIGCGPECRLEGRVGPTQSRRDHMAGMHRKRVKGGEPGNPLFIKKSPQSKAPSEGPPCKPPRLGNPLLTTASGVM